jgi:dipeptidyl aminopeptidase/acylaminoacyl peptidase
LLGGTPDEAPARYDAASPIELLPLGVRQLLIHGENDEIVPPALSRAYVEQAKRAGDPAELLLLAGTEHFGVIDPESAAWPRVQRAVLALFDRATPVATPSG